MVKSIRIRPVGTLDVRPIEVFSRVGVSEHLVRLIVGTSGRDILLMWDMTREQAATLTAIIDGRLSDYRTTKEPA